MKMRQVIAIGGGGFGRTQESNLIEQFILDQTSKKNPKICFIPTATGDLDPYIVNYYSVFSKLNCEATHISFFKRTIDLEEHVLKQDAIFVGGGNTKSMLAVWKDWGLDSLLKIAYEKGTIMCGVSAGAICWFESGITDSWAEELKQISAESSITKLHDKNVLIVHGTEDDVVSSLEARALSDAHGNTDMRLIEGAGHHLRHDPRAIAVLLGWLDRQRRSSK